MHTDYGNLDELPQLVRFCRPMSSITHAWEVSYLTGTERILVGFATNANVLHAILVLRWTVDRRHTCETFMHFAWTSGCFSLRIESAVES